MTIVLRLRLRPSQDKNRAAVGLPLWPRLRFRTAWQLVLGVAWGVALGPITPTLAYTEPVLQVGIVQRFSSKPDDHLILRALPGDRLTLRFETNGQPETLTATQVRLEATRRSLAAPMVEERLVLSTHRSFESAEDSANQWQARGIAIEVAQPGNWQVWADRQTYRTPLLRRWLLQSLQSQGHTLPHLDTQVLNSQPGLSWIVNGYRYNRDRLEITTGTGVLQVEQPRQETRRYGGTFRIQPNAYGTYTLVNWVPLETYLRGVVPHEIGAGAPRSAVEAQAILARTYALRNLRRFAIDDYELCADTQCQVYWGLSGTATATDQAIQATRGLVLTYQNEMVDALYSSTTGGVTAAFQDVWNGFSRPYLRSVIDSVNPVWNLAQNSLAQEQNVRAFLSQKQGFNEVGWWAFRWREESSLAALNQELRRYLTSKQHPLANFQTIQQMQVTQRAPGGRVLHLTVTTDRGPVVLEKDEIIRAFEAPNSTLFYLDPLMGQGGLRGYAFIGGGFGHGVGMSQTGSYHLAEIGWPAARILSFYYPGTQLQMLNPAIVLWQGETLAQRARSLNPPQP